MDDAKRELVRAWLIKARNDLTTARVEEALKLAGGYWAFVCSLLPAEVQPGK